jgi:hypothetical protein
MVGIASAYCTIQVRGPFFSGKSPTLPDIVIAPFILRTRMRISNRPFQSARYADATAGKRYQEYAAKLLELQALQRTSPDSEEPIDVSKPPSLAGLIVSYGQSTYIGKSASLPV